MIQFNDPLSMTKEQRENAFSPRKFYLADESKLATPSKILIFLFPREQRTFTNFYPMFLTNTSCSLHLN